MQNSIEVKEAFETLRDFCKSNVDGCSKCKFAFGGNKCSLFQQYPCNWGKFDFLYVDKSYLTKEVYTSMCPLGADLVLEDGKQICKKANGEVVKCGLNKCALQPLAFCPNCGGEHMEVTGNDELFAIECYNFGNACGFTHVSSFKSVTEMCLEFDKKYLNKE